MTNKVSILIPTYKRPDYLHRCLTSIMQFVESEYIGEVIISDNFSEDRTVFVVSEFISKSTKIKYFQQDNNIGAIKNVLFLLNKATCEFVTFITDDDFYTVDFQDLLREFVSSESDFGRFPVVIKFEKQGKYFNYLDCVEITYGQLALQSKANLEVLLKSHILSGNIYRTKIAKDVLKKCNLENNWYPHTFITSEFIKENRGLFFKPQLSIFHTWENEIFWGEFRNDALEMSEVLAFENLIGICNNRFVFEYLKANGKHNHLIEHLNFNQKIHLYIFIFLKKIYATLRLCKKIISK